MGKIRAGFKIAVLTMFILAFVFIFTPVAISAGGGSFVGGETDMDADKTDFGRNSDNFKSKDIIEFEKNEKTLKIDPEPNKPKHKNWFEEEPRGERGIFDEWGVNKGRVEFEKYDTMPDDAMPKIDSEDQAETKLTMKLAIKLASEQNIKILTPEKREKMAKNNIKQANRLQNPSIQAMILLGEAAQGNTQQFGLFLPIEILKRGPKKRLAMCQEDIISSNTQDLIFQLKINARQAYIDVTGAKTTLKIIEIQQNAFDEIMRVAQGRFDKGEIPESEYLQVKIFFEQFDIARNSTLAELLAQKHNFNKVLNQNGNKNSFDTMYDEFASILSRGLNQVQYEDFLTPAPTEIIKSYAEVEKIMLENRIDVQLAQKQILAAQQDLNVQTSKRIPDLEIYGGFAIITSDIGNDSRHSLPFWGSYVGGNILVPSIYRYTPEIENAKIEIEKSQANLKTTIYAAKEDLKTAYANFEISRDNLNYFSKDLIESTVQIAQVVLKNYEAGRAGLGDVMSAQQLYLNTLSSYTNALLHYYSSFVELLRETGVESLD